MKRNTKQEQDEETISLCDFPLNSNEFKNTNTRRSTSEPSDFFEFFNHLHSTENISHAEDIFFRGKLLPYKRRPNFDDQILNSVSNQYDSVKFSKSITSRVQLTRSSRSLDCKRQSRRNSSLVVKSEASDINRSFSKGSARSEPLRGSKPRWYGLMFGAMKFPAEMDIKEMKSRQVRRSTGSLVAAADRRRIWGQDLLLRVLSCKSHASVAVAATPSFGLVPQV